MKADGTKGLLAWKHDQACDQEHHSKHHKKRVTGFFPACIIEHFCRLLRKKKKSQHHYRYLISQNEINSFLFKGKHPQTQEKWADHKYLNIKILYHSYWNGNIFQYYYHKHHHLWKKYHPYLWWRAGRPLKEPDIYCVYPQCILTSKRKSEESWTSMTRVPMRM